VFEHLTLVVLFLGFGDLTFPIIKSVSNAQNLTPQKKQNKTLFF
jgi:hypothetical protein